MGAYCDVVVDLSAAFADSGCPKELSVVCNVHGVRDEFIAIGDKRGQQRREGGRGGDQQEGQHERQRIYFLGKKLWTKGYRELLSLLDSQAFRDHQNAPSSGASPSALPPIGPIDLYGSGPDEKAIVVEAERLDEAWRTRQ